MFRCCLFLLEIFLCLNRCHQVETTFHLRKKKTTQIKCSSHERMTYLSVKLSRPWWSPHKMLQFVRATMSFDTHTEQCKNWPWQTLSQEHTLKVSDLKRYQDIRFIHSFHLSVLVRKKRKRGDFCFGVSVTKWVCLRRLVGEINSSAHFCHWVLLNLDTA